jgi:hypothetical protein
MTQADAALGPAPAKISVKETRMQLPSVLFLAAATALCAGGVAAQVPTPLPRPVALTPGRQAAPLPSARPAASPAARAAAALAPSAIPLSETAKPGGSATDCTDLLAADIAVVELTTAVSGAAGSALCGDEAPVRMRAVKLRNGGTVEFEPAVIARCEMAREFARWVRDGIAAAATPHDGVLQRIEIAASYSCRQRNNVAGARLSEHGLANAIDIGAIVVSRGGRIAVNDPCDRRSCSTRCDARPARDSQRCSDQAPTPHTPITCT